MITAPQTIRHSPRNIETTVASEAGDLTAALHLSLPSSKSSPSFSLLSLYQTTCCNFFCLSFHWITQFFSANFPLTSCCYPSSPLSPVPGNSPAKPAREESRPSKQEGKFYISFLILSFKSNPQVTFSAMQQPSCGALSSLSAPVPRGPNRSW